MPSLLSVADELQSQVEDRFHRFSLIGWWDQARLSTAKVLVIGAGALGNELIKNAALVGIGNLFIADLDRIENSNLSRSILYRAADNGQPKAEVAARAAQQIYPAVNVQAFHGNVVHDLGLGVFRWADVVLGGLDNREARLAINRNCWKVNRPWIDGAIEQIQGIARVFVPDGPCYECTMSERDWEVLRRRRSCNLLTRSEMEQGRTPTTPTISSIVAGVQSQELVKLLHGLPVMSGRGWIFEGLSGESYQVEYQRKAECYSHDTLTEIVELNWKSDQTTPRMLLNEAERLMGGEAVLELNREILAELTCPQCGATEEVYGSLGKFTVDQARCTKCPDTMRTPRIFHQFSAADLCLDRTLDQLGLPPFDIVSARHGARSLGLELAGDGPCVLGSLSGDASEVEWS